MAIQLTAEQEQRIQAVVNAGAYPSTEVALDAALAAVESVAAHDFEGTPQELEELLLEGIDSGQPQEADEAFWQRITTTTDDILAAHQARKPRS